MRLLTEKESKTRFDEPIEAAIEKITALLHGSYNVSKRAIALLLLQEDPEVLSMVKAKESSTFEAILKIIQRLKAGYRHSLNYIIAMSLQKRTKSLLDGVVIYGTQGKGFAERLSQFTISPWTGFPLMLLVLYFGLYKFVGSFGAGTIVGLLENNLFEGFITPFIIRWVKAFIPLELLQDLLVGEYGLITLGLRYAVAIVLPIVGTFFLFFSVIEDVGYLPRLSMMVDRLFKKIGLNGRAVIPMVLGLGCDTMATMVTRVLQTSRERIIATLLLALAIPCSAQLGVILAILSAMPRALLLWAGFISLEFLLVGFLASKVLPGERPSFYMELPPMRLPLLSNVLTKTYTRMKWYFFEVLPLFLLASFLIWLGQLTGLFTRVISGLEPLVKVIGLPREVATVFLFGFFRRDYGAAGLYDLSKKGLLTGREMTVAAITLTLFIPCIAQFLMMKKERGLKVTLLMTLFITVMAFLSGFFVNQFLLFLKVP